MACGARSYASKDFAIFALLFSFRREYVQTYNWGATLSKRKKRVFATLYISLKFDEILFVRTPATNIKITHTIMSPSYSDKHPPYYHALSAISYSLDGLLQSLYDLTARE